MKKYLLLTKVLFKVGLGNLNNTKKKRFNISRKFLYVFLFVCFIPMMSSLFMAGKEGYFLLNPIGQEGVIINIICLAATLMTLVFGITVVMSVYYYTKDIEYLLPLPLKPYQIIGAKFTITLFYEYLYMVLLILPAFIGYGIAAEAGITYWISTAIAVILLPVVPLIYGSVISMVIMLVFKKAKNRDFFTILTSLFIVVIILGINGFTNQMARMSSEAITELILKGNNSLAGPVNYIFPNLGWLEKAMTSGDILPLFIYIATSIAYIIIFLFIAKLLYFKGVSGVSNTPARRKSISEEESNRIVRKNNPVRTYVLKELKLLLRTPIYFLNCFLMTLIWPLIIVIMFIGNIFSDEGFHISSMIEIFGHSASINALCILDVFVISIFVVSVSYTSGTSLSREGRNIFVMKYIPMDYKKQLFAKAMSGIILSLIGTTLYCFIAMLLLKMPAYAIIISTIISILSSFLFNYLQILVDIIRPKLNWENEQGAVKQNMNTFIEFLISIVIGGVIAFISIKLYLSFNISIYIISISLTIVLLILAIVMHKVVMGVGERKLKSLEN